MVKKKNLILKLAILSTSSINGSTYKEFSYMWKQKNPPQAGYFLASHKSNKLGIPRYVVASLLAMNLLKRGIIWIPQSMGWRCWTSPFPSSTSTNVMGEIFIFNSFFQLEMLYQKSIQTSKSSNMDSRNPHCKNAWSFTAFWWSQNPQIPPKSRKSTASGLPSWLPSLPAMTWPYAWNLETIILALDLDKLSKHMSHVLWFNKNMTII